METLTYGTRWSRASLLFVLAFVALVAMVFMMRQQVLATAFTVQGTTAQFSTGSVRGTDVGFGMTRVNSLSASGTTSTKSVFSSGFATGQLDGLCLSSTESIGPLGTYTIRITAGDNNPATNEVSANNMQFDLTNLRGDGPGIRLDGIVQMGLSSSDVTTVAGVANPLDAPTGTGFFAIDATAGDIANVRGKLYDVQINGAIKMPGLKITLTPGTSQQCDNTPIPH